MNDTPEKEVTKQISIVSLTILIAFCSLLFKCSHTNNQYALNYHKAVEVCKNEINCIKCYLAHTNLNGSLKDCVGAKQ